MEHFYWSASTYFLLSLLTQWHSVDKIKFLLSLRMCATPWQTYTHLLKCVNILHLIWFCSICGIHAIVKTCVINSLENSIMSLSMREICNPYVPTKRSSLYIKLQLIVLFHIFYVFMGHISCPYSNFQRSFLLRCVCVLNDWSTGTLIFLSDIWSVFLKMCKWFRHSTVSKPSRNIMYDSL